MCVCLCVHAHVCISNILTHTRIHLFSPFGDKMYILFLEMILIENSSWGFLVTILREHKAGNPILAFISFPLYIQVLEFQQFKKSLFMLGIF